MEVHEFASLIDVPILKAGVHPSRNAGNVEVSEDMLDHIIEGSNACKDIVKDAMITGEYRGNPMKLSKPIPGPINLHHNDILDETIKHRVANVDFSFNKRKIAGETWMTETLTNVPKDIAKSIQTHFPGRSVELIPLTHPDTGKKYTMVVRSTAFLDKYTPPAVKGQQHDLQVEFAEGETPIIVLCSGTDLLTSVEKENTTMTEETTKQPENQAVDVSELAAKDAKIAELQAELEKGKEREAKIADLESALEEHGRLATELIAKQDASEIAEFIGKIEHARPVDDNGVKYEVSPAFLELARPLIETTSRTSVIEMSGEQKPARQTLSDTLAKVIEMAAKHAILVPMTEMGTAGSQEPTASKLERAKAYQEEHKVSYVDALNAISRGE